MSLAGVHNELDAIGLVPGIGEPADATNGLLYAFEGDWFGAGTSWIAVIPIIGYFGNAAKGLRYADEAFSFAEEAAGPTLRRSKTARHMVDEGELSEYTARKLDLVRPDHHHLAPEKYKDWFDEHGFEIDTMTSKLDDAMHGALHTWGWSDKVMDRLVLAEARLGRKLTPEEIKKILQELWGEAGMVGHLIIPYPTD